MKRFLQPIIREVGQAIAQEASKASKRSLPDVISISVTIILTLIGMVGAVITVYMYLSENILDRHAMLIVTLGVVFFAFVSGSIAKKIMMDNRVRPVPEDSETENQNNQQNDMVATLGVETAKLITHNPKNAALIALAAGVSMGVSPELRKAVFDHLSPKA